MAVKSKAEEVAFNLFTDFSYEDVKENVFARAVAQSGDHVLSDDGSTEGEASTASAVEGKSSAKRTRIEDFGEKIGGARKDLYAVYRDLLSYSAMLDVSKVPFSKAWPKPNYEKLLEGGMDSWKVDAIRALRDVVSHVPRRKAYKWTFECLCVAFREHAVKVVNGEFDDLDDLCKALNDYNENDSRIRATYRNEFKRLAALYGKIGHSEELPQFSIYHYVTYYPSGWQDKEPLHNVYVASIKTGAYTGKDVAYAASEEETFSLLAEYLQQERKEDTVTYSVHTKRQGASRQRYKVYEFNGQDIYICRKVGKHIIKVKGPFSDSMAAFDYRSSHLEELDDCFAAMKNLPNERGEDNQPRSGEAYREGDVKPEDFLKAFGFRGVEFGNYVEGPRRQQDLNDAYDALMDLSKVTGLPPRALSLGGKLGLAFGARGRGGKNPALAHYESYRTVINLTKRRGAGSLGHEWFHALDNMLAREHKKGVTNFFSENHCGISNVELSSAMAELRDAMRYQTEVISRSKKLDSFREKPYWGTTPEYMARSFEAYLKAKLEQTGIRNDYLVNVLDEEAWKQKTNAPYAYPTKKETEAVQPYFDALFSNIRQRAEGENIILYSASADIDAKNLDNKRIPYDKLSPEELGLFAFGEQVLGIQTAFYDGDPKLHGHFDVSTSTIYLNRSSECDLPWVFAHEAFHAMKEADPALYGEIMQLAGGVESFSKEKIDAYRSERRKPNMPDDLVRQEMLADAFADYTTGRRAFLEMAGKQPNTVRRTLNYLARAMNELKSMFFGSKRRETERKYPNVAISRDQFHDLSRGFEYLQQELRQQQHLTKGQDMFLSMLAESPKFDGVIHSPYAYIPEKQFDFDCKSMEAMSVLYPDIPRERVATAIAIISPCGALRYEEMLLESSRGREIER